MHIHTHTNTHTHTHTCRRRMLTTAAQSLPAFAKCSINIKSNDTYIQTYTHAYLHTHVRTYIQIHEYICVQICMHIHIYMQKYIHTCNNAYTDTYIYIYTNKDKYMRSCRTHTYLHVYLYFRFFLKSFELSGIPLFKKHTALFEIFGWLFQFLLFVTLHWAGCID